MGRDVAQLDITARDLTAEAFNSVKRQMQGVSSQTDALKAGLLGLTSALGVGAFAAMIRSSIDATAGLKAMSEITGATVEGLSQLKGIARLSGTEFDSVGAGLVKLAKNMQDAKDGTGNAASALQALGLSATNAAGNLRQPDEMFGLIAKSLAKYEDGAGKTAVATALLGKAGAQLLPVLNDLAVAGDYEVKLTKKQAEQADEFNKNLVRLSASSRGFVTILAADMVPTLNDFVTVLLHAQQETGGLKEQAAKLSAEGSIKNWARDAALGVAFLVDVVDGVVRVFKVAGSALAAVAADATGFIDIMAGGLAYLTGQWDKGQRLMQSGMNQIKSDGEAFSADFTAIMTKAQFSDKLKAQFAESDTAAKQFTGTVREQLNFTLHDGKVNVDELSKAFDALKDSLGKDDAKLQAEVDSMRQFGLVTKETAVAMLQFQLTQTKLKDLAQPLKDELLTLAKRKDALTVQLDMEKQWIDWRKKWLDTEVQSIDKINDEVKALTLKNDAVGKSAGYVIEQTIKELEAKKNVLEISDLEVKAIQLQIDANKRLLGETNRAEQLQGQVDLWKKIESTAHDTFISIFDSGKSAFDRLRDTLKNGLYELLYQMTVKQWVINIGASMSGSGGFAGAGGTAQGIGGLFNTGSSIYSMFSGGSAGLVSSFGSGASALGGFLGSSSLGAFGTGVSGMAGSTAAGFVGPTTAGALGAEGAGAMAGSALGAVAAVAPYIAAAILLYEAFATKGGGPKIEGNAFANQQGLFNPGGPWSGNRFFTGSSGSAQIAPIAQSVAQQFKAVFSDLKMATPNTGFGLGFDTDPQGTAQNRIKSQVLGPGGNVLYSYQNENLGRDPAQLQAALGLEATKLLIAGLQASNLPPLLAKVFQGINVAGLDQTTATNVLATFQATEQLYKAIGAGAPVMEAQKSLFNQWIAAIGSTRESLLGFDSSLAALQQLGALNQNRYQIELQLVQQIADVSKSVKDTFGSSIESIKLSQLDQAGKYGYFQNLAQSQFSQLSTSTDPAMIQQLSASLNQSTNSAFGLLDSAGQQAAAGGFIDFLSQAQAKAEERLAAARQAIDDQNNAKLANSIADAILKALEIPAASIADAGDAMVGAAQIIAGRMQGSPVASVPASNFSEVGTRNLVGLFTGR